MKRVIAYTDGGCRGNGSENNVGAYGVVLMYKRPNGEVAYKEISEGFVNTTNNKMELQAVIRALEELNCHCEVELYTDSRYVCDAINKGWVRNWINKGWVTSSNTPVKNQEQWIKLVFLMKKHKVSFNWVKGHADNEFNNRCDELANIQMDLMLERKE